MKAPPTLWSRILKTRSLYDDSCGRSGWRAAERQEASRRRHLSVAPILASFAYLATQVAGEHGERRRGHKEHEEGQRRRVAQVEELERDRKSTRLNSCHV